MNIRIIAIGKIKEDYLKSGISEYLKRLQKYAKVEIVEVSDSPLPDNPNDSEIEKAKNQEGERVLKLLPYIKENEDYMVMMAEAWLLATIAIIYPNEVLAYLDKINDKTLRLKTISKINESFRISDELKFQFKSLR